MLTRSDCLCILCGVFVANIEIQLWQLHKEKRELRKSHLDYWESTIADTGTGRPVDAIISPAVAYTAVPHGLNTSVSAMHILEPS